MEEIENIARTTNLTRIASCSKNWPANLGSSFDKKRFKETARRNV